MSNGTQPINAKHSPAIAAAIAEFESEIAQLCVTVVTVLPEYFPDGRWGAYDYAARTIGPRLTLAPIQARSTLAHVLPHAKHGHSGQQECQEREAESTAAAPLSGAWTSSGRRRRDLTSLEPCRSY